MLLDRELVYEALPAYRLGRELGRGGFGVVFEGRHRRLDRDVAVKILPRAFGADPTVRRRFLVEARVVASFGHPHIVEVYDFVEHEGVCALVMERLATDDAGQRAAAGSLGVEGAVAVGIAVADALAYAHARDVLHRDVKPENVLFNVDGVPKMTDFGLARMLASRSVMTGTGQLLGSPAYMAPEVIRGEEAGPASDLYSLGVTLYELLVGHLPFATSVNPASVLYRQVHEPAPKIPGAVSVPELVATEVIQALAKDPDDRHASAAAMGRALLVAADRSFGPGWLDACPVRVAGPARISGPVPADARARTGGPAPSARPVTNLPAQVTSFVGRDDDLAAVEEALERARIVTLTGVGGVGKTRLAIEAATWLAPRYDDGAWLVELVGVSDPDAVPDAVASALGVAHRQGEPIRATLLDYLRGRVLLLVLDNCEHVVDVCAGLVDDVVHAAPAVTVLATSQRALGLVGEHLLVVPPLELPVEDGDCRAVAEAPSVRLFAERAAAVRAGFQVTDRNAGAVATLCRQLDGIPLALELAAARVRSMTPEEIAPRLVKRFELLTSGHRGVDRHETLLATVDWSHSFLDDAERAVLRRSSVFAGGFTLQAAEAVTAGAGIDEGRVVDLLGRLVDRSLLLADDDLGSTRFSLLETIRHYAAERLVEAGEQLDAQRRHAEHYAEFVETAGAGLQGPDETMWSRRLAREIDNLRTAVAWAADAGEAELAVRLVVGARAHPGTPAFVAATTLAERIHQVPELAGQRLYPALLTCAAWGALLRGDLGEAARLARSSIAHEGRLGTSPDPLPRRVLGLAAIAEGRVDESCRWSEEALRSARQAGAPAALTFSLAALALALCIVGDTDRALPLGEEAVEVARDLGSPTMVSYALTAHGYARSVTDPEAAVAALEEAVKLAETAVSHTLRGQALSIQGRTHLLAGQRTAALERLGEAIDDLHRVGHRPLLSAALARVAAALVQAEQYEVAAMALGAVDVRPSPYLADPVDRDAIAGAEAGLAAALGADRVTRLRRAGARLADDDIAQRVGAALSDALNRRRGGRATG